MAQTKTLMTAQGTTGPGAWHTLHPEMSNRGYVISLGGVAAAVTAKVIIEVDNNDGIPATRLTFNLDGTSTLTVPVTNSDVDPNAPFPRVRANVVSVNGGGLVSASVTAAASGMGAA